MALNLDEDRTPGVVGGHTTVGPSSYRSAESEEVETSKFHAIAGAGYEVIHTVTTGKSWYVTTIIVGDPVGITATIATGGGGSEVDILGVSATAATTHIIQLITPMKFSSGTRVTVKDSTAAASITMVGFEE